MSIAAGRYYSLNAVGARFWALIQQPTSIRAAATTIVTEFDAPQDVVEQDLIELVGQFLGAGLVEVAGSSPASP